MKKWKCQCTEKDFNEQEGRQNGKKTKRGNCKHHRALPRKFLHLHPYKIILTKSSCYNRVKERIRGHLIHDPFKYFMMLMCISWYSFNYFHLSMVLWSPKGAFCVLSLLLISFNRVSNRNHSVGSSERYVQQIMVMWQICSKKCWPLFTLSAKIFALMFNINLKSGVIHRCRNFLINISRSNIDAAYLSTENREAKWSFKTLSALLQYKQHGKKITYQLSNIPLSSPSMRYQGLWKECTVIKNSQWRVQIMFHTT